MVNRIILLAFHYRSSIMHIDAVATTVHNG